MTIVTGRELLQVASTRQRAIPAFDVAGGNIDILHAVCTVLRERQVYAFLASTPASISAYHGFVHFVESVRDVAAHYDVSVSPHLDHATNEKDIIAALEAGCTSVMYDGSRHSYEENLSRSRDIVAIAHGYGASVETELGIIAGKEDDVISASNLFPTVQEAAEFCRLTKSDWFAPAVGTQHGFYRTEPAIQWELAGKIRDACDSPLVLHGATGLPDGTVRRLVDLGFQKINFATGLRSAFTQGIQEEICKADVSMKPQVYLANGRKSVQQFVSHIYDLVSSDS